MKSLNLHVLVVIMIVVSGVQTAHRSMYSQPVAGNNVSLSREIELALEMMRLSKYADANSKWFGILASHSNELSAKEKALIYLQRGVCYRRMCADTLALESVSASLALVPLADAYYTRAELYLRQKMAARALPDINHALEIFPDRGDYYMLRGNIRFELGLKADACADIAMANLLGAGVPDDIMREPCALLGVPTEVAMEQQDTASLQAKSPSHHAQMSTVADTIVHSLIGRTNNLNTSYHVFSVQAQYGGSIVAMLSRLFYDVGAGNTMMVNVGYGISRILSFWAGAAWSTMPYTFGSERSRIASESSPPFGHVYSIMGLVGAQYSIVFSNSVDAQLALGLGYKHTRYPAEKTISLNGGGVYRPNLGIEEANGLNVQSSLGVEWRIFKNVALTGNLVFGLSFSQYNFLTVNRLDRENVHQHMSYVGGVRLYLWERSEVEPVEEKMP